MEDGLYSLYNQRSIYTLALVKNNKIYFGFEYIKEGVFYQNSSSPYELFPSSVAFAVLVRILPL